MIFTQGAKFHHTRRYSAQGLELVHGDMPCKSPTPNQRAYNAQKKKRCGNHEDRSRSKIVTERERWSAAIFANGSKENSTAVTHPCCGPPS